MDLEGGKITLSGGELLKAQAHIWNHIFNFINSMALNCAVQLEIPDAINRHGTQPMPLSKLVSVLRLDPRRTHCLYRLMRLLVHSGFFKMQRVNENGGEEEEEEGYVLTNSSRLLLKDNPTAVTPFLLSVLDPVLLETWQSLSTWFRSDDQTAFDTAQRKPVWEYCSSDPKASHTFYEGMASDARLVASILVDKHNGVFDGVDSMVDVGGGTGTVAKAIAEAFPEMECSVFDLPRVVTDLKGNHNLKYLGGDMFQAIPPADVLLLKWVLHDRSDEECVKILKKCKEAVTSNGKKGKVMVIDMVVENGKGDDKSTETQLFFDLQMMTIVGGKERNEVEWAKLFYDAGFSHYKIFRILDLRCLIEIYP